MLSLEPFQLGLEIQPDPKTYFARYNYLRVFSAKHKLNTHLQRGTADQAGQICRDEDSKKQIKIIGIKTNF